MAANAEQGPRLEPGSRPHLQRSESGDSRREQHPKTGNAVMLRHSAGWLHYVRDRNLLWSCHHPSYFLVSSSHVAPPRRSN